MDKRFRGKQGWIVVAVLGILFLCLMLCVLGAVAMLFMRSGGVHVQPPAGGEGAIPQIFHGPRGLGRPGGFGLLAILGGGFSLLIFGLFLLLFVGLAKRLIWGSWHSHHRPIGRHHWGHSPEGKGWRGKPHPPWGPRTWHGHGEPGEAEESIGGEAEPEGSDSANGEAE